MKKRRNYHHGDLRAALLDAALDDIRRVGIAATSLRQVARSVGVVPSAAYKHFKSKGELVGAIGADGFRLLAAQMQKQAARAPKDSRAQLSALGRGYVLFAVEQPEQFKVMFDAQGAANAKSRPENPAYQLLAGAIARLRKEGRISRGVRLPELAAWSMVHGLARLVIDGVYPATSRTKIDDAMKTIARVVLDGLGAGSSQ